MNVTALRRFYAEQIAAAKADNALFSLHLKCTMMKVSDPIMFGHCVAVYFADALEKHAGAIQKIGANVNNGLSDVLGKLDQLPAGKKAEIEADIAACYKERPGLAMVDSRAGKTNLHVPSDVIIDASMPVVTIFGLQIGYLLGGAVIVEQIFSFPGLGTYMLNGITDHDLPVVQGVAIVFVLFQMAMSLLADISYGYLNPKVRVA